MDPIQLLGIAFHIVSELYSPSGDSTLQIDQLSMLETIVSAATAAQAKTAEAIEQTQRRQQVAANWKPSQIGKGIGEQIGLARRTSPSGGAQYLSFARSLCTRFERAFDQLRQGRISEQACKILVTKTSHLTDEQARQIDAELAPLMPGWNRKRTEAAVSAAAYRIDPQGWVDRRGAAERERRVWIRPAPDAMAIVSALLPAAQGVAVFAHLSRAAQTLVGTGEADGRGLGQVMADTLVERITGQATAGEVSAEVLLTVTPETLLGGGDEPGWLEHYGPVSAEHARSIASGPPTSCTAPDISATVLAGARIWIRRVLTDPITGVAVDVDQRRRLFDGTLRRLITIRDRECRGPFCAAPIREVDHVIPFVAGGPTSIGNGQGVCQRNNQLKELPGWTVTRGKKPGELITSTPTGHTYRTTPPPQVGYPAGTVAGPSPRQTGGPTAA